MTDTNENFATRLFGIIKDVSRDRDFGFVSNVLGVKGDTFLHCTDFGSRNDKVPDIGTWVEYEFQESPKGPRAVLAVPCSMEPEDRMKRLLAQYGHAMQTNHGSLRLDGLTQDEGRRLKDRRVISLLDYYACMSENGLRGAANAHGVDFVWGKQLEIATAIVAAIRAKEDESDGQQR